MRRARILRLIGWVFAATLSNIATAQEYDPPLNVRLIGQMGGWSWAVQVDGEYAYLGEGGNLTVLDISDPSLPILLGHLSLSGFTILDIETKDNTTYVVGWGSLGFQGLQIVDVSNSYQPRLVGYYPAPVAAQGVYVTGDLVYVACGYQSYGGGGGFQILDVSDPTSPTLRGSFIWSHFFASQIHVRDTIAYLAAYDGLHIYDVTTPSIPAHLALYSQSECHDVFVRDNLAYTATGHGLEIVDVTNPTAPIRRGRLLDSQAFGLSVSGGLTFLAQPDYGLKTAVTTSPSAPTYLGSYPTSGMAWGVAASTGTAYLADGPGGLSIIDVANPSSPTLRARYNTLSDANDVYVADGVAYLANGVRGMKTVDVANPQSPRILGSLSLPGEAQKITLSGGTAYICDNSGLTLEDWRSFLHIVDVTTPSAPQWLGSYRAPEAWDVAVSGPLAYVTHNDGFHIVDVSDPTSPTFRGSFTTPGSPHGIFVSGDIAYVADYTSFRIVDVSNPSSPVLRSSYPGFRITEVFVSDGIAYITGSWSGADFQCVDVSDADNPRFLGRYDVPNLSDVSYALHVSNGLACFVLDSLRVLDVSDPTKPTLCGFYPTASTIFGTGLFAEGNLVYLADFAGLRIFKYTGGDTAAPRWQQYR